MMRSWTFSLRASPPRLGYGSVFRESACSVRATRRPADQRGTEAGRFARRSLEASPADPRAPGASARRAAQRTRGGVCFYVGPPNPPREPDALTTMSLASGRAHTHRSSCAIEKPCLASTPPAGGSGNKCTPGQGTPGPGSSGHPCGESGAVGGTWPREAGGGTASPRKCLVQRPRGRGLYRYRSRPRGFAPHGPPFVRAVTAHWRPRRLVAAAAADGSPFYNSRPALPLFARSRGPCDKLESKSQAEITRARARLLSPFLFPYFAEYFSTALRRRWQGRPSPLNAMSGGQQCVDVLSPPLSGGRGECVGDDPQWVDRAVGRCLG